MLEVIASAVDEPGAHVALLGTCKRLRDAAYAAPCSLLVRTPSQAGWRARRRLHFAALARRGTGRRAPVRAEVGFPTETAAAAAHLLASVMRFLSTHKQVQSLTLRRCYPMDTGAWADEGAGDHGASGKDWAADGYKADAVMNSVRDGGVGSVVDGEGAGCSNAAANGHESDCVGAEQGDTSDETDEDSDFEDPLTWDISVDIDFFIKLVPLFERLPLTSLCVPDMVFNMWRKAPILLALSAVPLRRLHVTNLFRAATWVSVLYALNDHAATLEELKLGDEDPMIDREPDDALSCWPSPRNVFPHLTALTLVNLNVDQAAAANIAANCAALTHLDVRGNWKTGAGAALRFPATLPALTHVSWFAWGYMQNELATTTSQAAEFGAFVGGRTQLAALSLGGAFSSNLEMQLVCDIIHACPQLAASLHIPGWVINDAAIAALCGAAGAGRLTTLVVRLEPGAVRDSLCSLSQLPSLTDLTVRCDDGAWLAQPQSGWPLGRLIRLVVIMDEDGDGPDAAAPLAVVRALATSASARCTLRKLDLTAAPLTEATAATAVGALAALRRLDYTALVFNDRKDESRLQEGLAATAELRRWLRRRLPAVDASVVVCRV